MTLPPFDRLPRRPWFLAPPTQVTFAVDPDTLALHTIQTADAYRALRRTGSLLGHRSVWYESARFDVIHDEWWERTEPYHRLPLAGWPAPLRDELESSWALVFDLHHAGSSDLQAVVHELRAGDVTRAVRIH